MMLEVFRLNGNKIVHEKFDNETVVVNLQTGRYYNMLAIGSVIWELAVKGLPRNSIAEQIAAQYPAEAGRVTEDVLAFLDELVAENLLLAEPAATAPAAEAGDLSATEWPALYFAPRLQAYADMEDMLALDPIHDVDDIGWPVQKSDAK